MARHRKQTAEEQRQQRLALLQAIEYGASGRRTRRHISRHRSISSFTVFCALTLIFAFALISLIYEFLL